MISLFGKGCGRDCSCFIPAAYGYPWPDADTLDDPCHDRPCSFILSIPSATNFITTRRHMRCGSAIWSPVCEKRNPFTTPPPETSICRFPVDMLSLIHGQMRIWMPFKSGQIRICTKKKQLKTFSYRWGLSLQRYFCDILFSELLYLIQLLVRKRKCIRKTVLIARL